MLQILHTWVLQTPGPSPLYLMEIKNLYAMSHKLRIALIFGQEKNALLVVPFVALLNTTNRPGHGKIIQSTCCTLTNRQVESHTWHYIVRP